MKTFERVCKICGRKFEGKISFQRYCADCKNFSDSTKATGLFYNCGVDQRKRKYEMVNYADI